jgi:SIR2-like domain
MIDLHELKRRLIKPRPGRAIFFTGAGFSEGVKNSLDETIPMARNFAATLAREIGEQPEIPLTLISELYNEKHGDQKAILTLLKQTFTAKEVPDIQRRILKYPWKRIYTTNYDDVAEHVHGPDGTRPDSFSRNTLPMVLEGKRRQIVHVNGYVGEINRETVVDDFALTLSSYLDKNLFSSDWATTIRQDFELADLIVFAGYSLYDSRR